MSAWLLGALLAAQTPIYGDDPFTAILNHAGFEVRQKPCDAEAQEVRVAIFSNGSVQYNGEAKDAPAIAALVDQDWFRIRGICLYVEGPWPGSAREAFHQIVSAATRHSIGVARFTDAQFTQRAFPKFAMRPPSK